MKKLLLILILLLIIPQAGAQPTLDFPPRSGEYTVGTTSYHWTDESRPETFADSGRREIFVTVYYPAEEAGEEAPYVEGPLRDVLTETLGVAPETWDIIHTGILAGAPHAEGQFPLLIFSPGMGTLPLYYTSLLSEIASHGYNVAAIWHPYSTDVTVMPDGRVITASEDASPMMSMDFDAVRARNAALIDVWVGDMRFTLDQLLSLDDHIDAAKIGVFGHSFGGAAAAQAAYVDDRFLAVANMDGTPWAEVSTHGLTQPFLMFQTENEIQEAAQTSAPGFEAKAIQSLYESSTDGVIVSLHDSEHNTFTTDLLLFAPLLPEVITPEMIGTLESSRALEIINSYLVIFFDKHVKGEAVDFPDYDEVIRVD